MKVKAEKIANLTYCASSVVVENSGVPQSDSKAASDSRTLPAVVYVIDGTARVAANASSEEILSSRRRREIM